MAFKFVVLLALSAAYVQSYPQGSTGNVHPDSPLAKKFKTSVQKCKTDLNASNEALALIGKKAEPTTEEQRCFLECVYKDLDIVKDGKFNPEVVKELAKERYPGGGDSYNKAVESIDSCGKEISPSEGEKCGMGSAVRACFIKHADETNPPL